jgi:hypothetical protein
MVRIAALAAAPLLLYAPSAFAWGGLAHETICEIAFLELNDTARQRVIELIQQDSGFRTFRASCNWPDLPPRKRAPEHFVNVPRNMTAIGRMRARWPRNAPSPRSRTTSTLTDVRYDRWREFDSEDSLRFFALRLHEVGMIESSPNALLAAGTDWRLLNELKRELKA